MVRPVMLAVMLGVAGLSACGGKESTAPTVVKGADAGKVTAVQGTVTAMRGTIKRALAAGDAVAGDDLIETGADGRVTIVLDHNQVPFSLGPGRTQEVGKSPAWAAARGSAVAVTSTDRSGAAGRHAEREAADTLASAPTMAPAPAAPMAPPSVEPAAVAAAAPMPDRPAKSKASRRSQDDDLAAPANVDVAAAVSADRPAPGGAGGGGGGADTQATADVLTTDPLIGGRDRKMIGQASRGEPIGDVTPKPPAPGGPAPRLIASIETVDIKGGLAADLVLRKVRSRGLTLRECAGATPAVTRFDLTLTIAPSGAVGNAKAAGGPSDVETCLGKQLAALVFPASSTPTVALLHLSLIPR